MPKIVALYDFYNNCILRKLLWIFVWRSKQLRKLFLPTSALTFSKKLQSNCLQQPMRPTVTSTCWITQLMWAIPPHVVQRRKVCHQRSGGCPPASAEPVEAAACGTENGRLDCRQATSCFALGGQASVCVCVCVCSKRVGIGIWLFYWPICKLKPHLLTAEVLLQFCSSCSKPKLINIRYTLFSIKHKLLIHLLQPPPLCVSPSAEAKHMWSSEFVLMIQGFSKTTDSSISILKHERLPRRRLDLDASQFFAQRRPPSAHETLARYIWPTNN